MLKTMLDRPSMYSSAIVRLLMIGVPAIIIGLAYWSPILAASQPGVNQDETGRQGTVAQRLRSPAPEPSRKFLPAQEMVPPIAGQPSGVPSPAISQSDSEVVPGRSVISESTVPVIVGRVLYRGLVPAPTRIEIDRDQDVCGTIMSLTSLAVDAATHGLPDAVVHVEAGPGMAPAGGFAAAPIVVRNRQCRFHPHVAAAQVGSETGTFNDDPVMHSTNVTIANSTVFNVAMLAGGPPIKKRLKKAGLQMMTCNLHKFMRAYRLVFDDPYFDKTTETGQYSIAGVSPGWRRVTVWHEVLGVMEKDVQVPEQGTVVLDLEYK